MEVPTRGPWVDLGPENRFGELPAPVELDGQQYFLVHGPDGYRLLSRVCPHQGGIVMQADACFECPQHGWRFNRETGDALDVPQARLTSFGVTMRDGHLWAEAPPVAEGDGVPGPAVAAVRGRREKPSSRRAGGWPEGFAVKLVAHACLEIRHGDFMLLTDPWLSGPAFLGAWLPYPRCDADPAQLRPDAIWISHEHSDHFHPPSLRHFDRATPIYVPDFPNGRVARALAAMGFMSVHRMRFGQPYEIADGLTLTCFEPPGLWNDSILLVEAGGVRLLNINDAGVNHRIAPLVGKVDVLAAAFNPATSYPHVWSHLASDEKERISERARLGMLRMLHQSVKRYAPDYLLPFASHFTLWHPSHVGYLPHMKRNSLDDVVRAFRHTDVTVLDMLPGGSWEPSSGHLDIGPDRSRLYDLDYQLAWVRDAFDETLFESHHPAPGPLSQDQLEAYFLRLNAIPEIAFCEDLTVRLQDTSDAGEVDLSFQIASGRLSIIPGRVTQPNVAIQIPQRVLRHIVMNDTSWDEAHVGFWCRFSRTPDVFHAGFWRLLQAPYYRRSPELSRGDAAGVGMTSSVAELMERYGAPAERILARYGLHCAACPHASGESLAHAARRHGVDDAVTQRMLGELRLTLQEGIPADGPVGAAR